MNQFIGELDLRYLDGDRWLIREPFTFQYGLEYVHVGAGEIVNFASIPRPLKLIWPSPGGLWDLGSVVHDSLFARNLVWQVNGASRRVGFTEVNHIFAEAMKVKKVNGVTLRLMHAGVQVGGKGIWDRYRAADAARAATARPWWEDDAAHLKVA